MYKKKKKTSRRGGRVGRACQKVMFNTMQMKKKSWKEKKGKRETKHSYSSRALIRWQILFWMMAILPKRGRKPEGGRWRRGSCTLLYGGHRGKLQSSVTHLEYLTHRKTFFSNIKTFFLSFDCHDHFDRSRLGPRINFASETGVKVVPFGGRWRWKPNSDLFYKDRKWEALGD